MREQTEQQTEKLSELLKTAMEYIYQYLVTKKAKKQEEAIKLQGLK